MKRILVYVSLCMVAALSWSCNIDDDITTTLPPNIVLDSETGIYTVKQGREIIIAPSYESAEEATFSWTMGGEVLGTSPSLSFTGEEIGQYFITITVTTEGGSDEEEIRVDVIDLEIPTISIAGNKNLTVAVGTEVKFNSTVRETTLETTLEWNVNEQSCGKESTYTFKAEEVGSYTITVTATNEDGTHSDSVNVEVLNAEDMPFAWEFNRTEYHTVAGRRLQIKPSMVSNTEGVAFSWQIGDGEATEGEESFVFEPQKAGEYHIAATATSEQEDKHITLSHEFVVTVYEEGAFYREMSSTSKADWNKVYEYTPAPGQFINELQTGGFDGTQTTPEAAIAYAEARMSQTKEDGTPNPIWVSLGGFGGYIIVGFDHSIDNSGDYDLGILGNSFKGSSEPGIVWVMQDENGNGLPDDTWYELAGSETGNEETIQDYAVTYYRPTGPKMPVQWTDNYGNSGEIDYLKAFHRQDYYYPLWIEEDSYTLTGTCLKARNFDASGNGTYWVNAEYDWGYVDNFSPTDRLTDEANANADANANHFKISNAIDFECKPIHLDYIDFVKVQVGVNTKSGWLGEVSTEVFGFYDYNMKK
ncbi:MAG: PKD domain-containing protein [Alistipes sp.]|nr:PKD domain-containing protein [Alistipes sp.]